MGSSLFKKCKAGLDCIGDIVEYNTFAGISNNPVMAKNNDKDLPQVQVHGS